MSDAGLEPLGSSDDVVARLRLRAQIAAAEAGPEQGGAHARRRLRLGPSRLAVGGAAVVLALAALALLVPSLLAAAGDEPDPAAFGAVSSPVVWETDPADGASSAGAEPAKILVHVAGAVANPGVFELDVGARVVDALDKAGGANSDADLAALNLAARLADGERIYVPTPGETPPAVLNGGAGAQAGAATGGGADGGGRVNVNQAGAEALTALPGIGPVLADRIVQFRQDNGPFETLSDLGEVSGIGPKVLAGLEDAVAFE
ncbi:MAG: helix-hairpin-helix domain-containing protein [Bifidobacteriaceae bacterium]|jgi:competence protein ComEA|nr:helix-hairpin-helix domain-containing protein [Bifidobacteriaceae bacterium]